jgi:hypothetical protein
VLLAAALADRDRFDPVVVTGPQTGPEGSLLDALRERGVTVRVVPGCGKCRPLPTRAVRVLHRVFRDMHADVVHTNSSKAGVIGRVAVLVRLLEDDLAAPDVGREALQRLVDDELYADRRGQVEADVGAGHQVIERSALRMLPSTNSTSSLAQALDVFQASGAQIVEQMTESPRASRASARCEPMNPAPPVMRARMG